MKEWINKMKFSSKSAAVTVEIDNLNNKTSNPEMLRNYAIRLYENAGLRNKCIDNKCNLVYDDKVIRFEAYDIIVETPYSFLRTEDVHNAVNEIYGR